MGHCAAFFYTGDGLVASTEPLWLQLEFDTLTGLFGRVGLHKNVGNTVRMICRPCRTTGTQSEASYKRRMTGEGITYRYIQILRVKCPDCVVDLAEGFPVVH